MHSIRELPPHIVKRGEFEEQAAKYVKACHGAEFCAGPVLLVDPDPKLAAKLYGVSLTSINRARRLSPAELGAVRRGERPLVLPRPKPMAPAPADARTRLHNIVAEIGLDATLDVLAHYEARPVVADAA